MENSSLLETIESIAIEILKAKEALNKESAILLPEVVSEFKKRNSEIKETTLSAYMNKLTRTSTSPIKSAGKKKGFYFTVQNVNATVPSPSSSEKEPTPEISKNVTSITIAINDSSDQATKTRNQIEKKLYPIARDWLIAEGYSALVTGEKKGNGQWGNPDVTGIRVTHTVSETKEVEIATIEVKINDLDWRRQIFEAVSHTRFSNCTYFCFAYPESNRNSFDSEFYMYAEEFELGLLGIEMEDADFEKFVKNEYDPKYEDVEVIELNTPRFRTLRPYFREKFLKNLEISSLKDLILWPNQATALKPTGT